MARRKPQLVDGRPVEVWSGADSKQVSLYTEWFLLASHCVAMDDASPAQTMLTGRVTEPSQARPLVAGVTEPYRERRIGQPPTPTNPATLTPLSSLPPLRRRHPMAKEPQSRKVDFAFFRGMVPSVARRQGVSSSWKRTLVEHQVEAKQRQALAIEGTAAPETAESAHTREEGLATPALIARPQKAAKNGWPHKRKGVDPLACQPKAGARPGDCKATRPSRPPGYGLSKATRTHFTRAATATATPSAARTVRAAACRCVARLPDH